MKIILVPNSPKMTARHYRLANALVEQGHEVHYFIWDLPFRLKTSALLKHLFTSLVPNNYKFEQFSMHKVCRLPFFWPVVNGWLFKAQLRRLFRKLDADIIFAEGFTNETEIPKGLPFIYDLVDDYAAPPEVHGGAMYKLAFKLLGVSKVMRRQCQNALAVTAVSETLCDFAKRYNQKVIKLPNGVDSHLMRQILTDKTTHPTNPHSLVYMTGFGWWSRAIETLQAAVDLRKEFPNLELTLIGEGSESDKMIRFIHDHHAESYIHYLGFIYDRTDLLKELNKSAIGLNISDKNKFRDAAHPIKVIEYSGFGKKVVSTDLEEVKALNLPNVIMFSDADKNNTLKDAIRQALNTSGSADYTEISDDILLKYDWGVITKKLAKLAKQSVDKSNSRKVIHVTPSYPPNLGGLEKVVQALVTTQVKLGLRPEVVTSNHGVDRNINNEKVPVTRLKSKLIASTTIMPGLIGRMLRTSKDDLVHLHVTQAFTPEIVWLASKVKGFEYIAHVHLDVPPSGPAGFLLKFYKPVILRRVLRDASSVVVFSENQRQVMHDRYNIPLDRVKAIPNGAEEKFFFDGKRKMHPKPRLLFVGRLNYQKNLQQLLYALDGVSDQFETTLVGSGEDEAELRTLSIRLGLQNITFAGRLEGKPLLDLYKSSDIFVLPSEREGMPLVLLEAMAMGLPVVATDVTGTRDVVTNYENGILVPYRDNEALRAGLLTIAGNPSQYAAMHESALSKARNYRWAKIARQFSSLYKHETKIIEPVLNALPVFYERILPEPEASNEPKDNAFKLWKVILPLLAVANIAYLVDNFVGWMLTLAFFLLAPGYLFLNLLRHKIKSPWEVASFALGLSVLIMMLGGLVLNSLHAAGLEHPLTTLNIFVTLDVITLTLLALNRSKLLQIPHSYPKPTAEQICMVIALSLLPILSIGGAIRLNNGASNVITMLLFAAFPVLFVVLFWRNQLKSIYPYALFTMGLAVLFSTSLRGWLITGHDIHHEYLVFQQTMTRGYWFAVKSGDPYNACLSITILPTILAKITSIPAIDLFKTVFQMIFAFALVPVFSFIKRFSDDRKALVASFVYITFPAFLDDMPFINRQEIGILFLALLLLASVAEFSRRAKITLSLCLITGVILAHYSSGYILVAMLITTWLAYHLIPLKKKTWSQVYVPLLSVPVILFGVIFSYMWNAKITHSASNLEQTIQATVTDLVTNKSVTGGFSEYSLFGAQAQTSPEKQFEYYAGHADSIAHYAQPQLLEVTSLGKILSRFISVNAFNAFIHSIIARLFQLLLLLGAVILFFRIRKEPSPYSAFMYSLVVASLILLGTMTVLPQLAVNFSAIRLFQQILIVAALPIVLGLEALMSFLGRYKVQATALVLTFIFLDLSGFIPQSIGGFPPQLSLNNAGPYYDFFYTHQGDVESANWLSANYNKSLPVSMDTVSSSPIRTYPVRVGLGSIDQRTGYLLQEYVNVQQGKYRTFLDAGLVEYYAPSITSNKNLIYTSQYDRIYSGGQ